MFQAERACRPGFPGSPHRERRGTFSASIAGLTCLQLVFDGLSGHGGHFNASLHEMVSHCDTQVNHSNNPAKHAPKRQLPGCPLRWAIRPGPVREQNLQTQPAPVTSPHQFAPAQKTGAHTYQNIQILFAKRLSPF